MDTDHQIPDAAAAEAIFDARAGPRGEASKEKEVGDDLDGSETGKVESESEKCGGEGDLGICLDVMGWVFGWDRR
ncbi:hypothetical protein ACFXTN_018676 [Malus domestica]